ncbi:MAG TPA: hypothetical protein VLK58_02880, partial [Conexibacter sp.]|nr:hypothetical protein [Conexibacter sp.]
GDHSRSTIDLADHLPQIAGRPIDEHGPGGTASFARIAYLFAHVIYAHDFAHLSGLPCLAIIDSPRKDHGTGDDARRRSDSLIALLNVLNNKHSRDRPLQIFVFDGSMSQRRLHRTRDLTRIRLDGPIIRTDPPANPPQ